MLKFILSDKQVEQYHDFQKKHADCCLKKTGSPSGGSFDIIFHPTGIGNAVSVKCKFCGEHEDITDYSTW